MRRITTLAPYLDCRAKIQPRPVPRITGLHITNRWSRLGAKRVADSWQYIVRRGKGLSYHTTGIRVGLPDMAVYPQPSQQGWCVHPVQLTSKIVTVPVAQVRRRNRRSGDGVNPLLNFSAINAIGYLHNRALRECVARNVGGEINEILSNGISRTVTPVLRGVRRLQSPYR